MTTSKICNLLMVFFTGRFHQLPCLQMHVSNKIQVNTTPVWLLIDNCGDVVIFQIRYQENNMASNFSLSNQPARTSKRFIFTRNQSTILYYNKWEHYFWLFFLLLFVFSFLLTLCNKTIISSFFKDEFDHFLWYSWIYA